MKSPFSVVRTPNHPGAARKGDLFSVKCKGVPDLVKTGESDEFALINGNSSREEARKLCDALSEAWEDFFAGRIHTVGPR